MFQGAKVVLEQPQVKDADIMQKWFSDKAFRSLYTGYRGNSLDMVMADIKASQELTDPKTTRIDFIVRSKTSHEPIGVATIMGIDRQHGHAEIAFGIYDASKRLAGYGIDLMIVLLDIVFDVFGFKRVYMRLGDDNRLGLRSALSFGFQEEGRLRKHIFVGGQYMDQWILGLLDEEYRNLSVVQRWKKRFQ